MKSRIQPIILWSICVALVIVVASIARNAVARSHKSFITQSISSPNAVVSGVIRHDSNPVSGVTVELNWQGESQSITTGADGVYSISGVPTGSWLNIYVYPPVNMGLGFRGWRASSLSGDLIKDFDLVDGYHLQAEFHQPDGSPYNASNLQINPIGVRLPAGEVLPPLTSSKGTQIDMVLAPAFYAIYDSHPHQSPYYMPPTIYDLRSAELQNQVITMLNRPLPYPKQPPVASLITVSEPDIDGYATVTGAPGSVPPSVAIMVLNQSTTNLSMTASDGTGAFTTELYAPNGSWLLIKYDPRGDKLINLWLDRAFDYNDKLAAFAVTNSVQNLPGTTIRAGDLPPGGDGWQDFAAAGKKDWWAGWAMQGTLQTPSAQNLEVMPGETLTVTAQISFHSPELQCDEAPTQTLFGGISLTSLFAGNGRSMPWGTWFSSRLFTPTGLPIDHEAPTQSRDLGPIIYEDLTCLSEHTIGANLDVTFSLPSDIPEGIYEISLFVLSDIPETQDLPTLPVWYHDHERAYLPPIRVGDAAPPRIPWSLFLNDPVNGNRGVQALEDKEDYALPNRVRTAPEILILPRLDERTGESIPYRLEPGSYWVSGNDRRTPNPPHLPLYPPSGKLTLIIFKPDGSQETIGPADIIQTDIRTPSLLDGSDLDEGTGNLCDVYHLTTLQNEFAYTFDQDGLHSIVLSGQVEDIYGNPYPINATYEVLVAGLLDLDSDQLPGTPYQQGDAFAPGLHIYPPVPAQVEIRLVHMPDSDPAQAITHIINGHANRFGYFQPPVETEIRLNSPGEFRVDIMASYTDQNGDLWAGATTWGSVVERSNPEISAHGRRGMNFAGDTLVDTPTWFVSAQLPKNKIGIEHWLPYFNGDIAWGSEPGAATIMDDSSLSSIVTIRDLTGPSEKFYDLIRKYFERCRDPFAPPPTDSSLAGLEKRLDVGEAPLCIATSSGIDAEIQPDQVEYWGYWYSASERPDVHVREIIGEDGISTAYWRFNDTYGYQIGEPADGDQVSDIKWNFGGAVMRVISETNSINEYAIYGSFWVLLPLDDPLGPRVTPPFQVNAGTINGGPIMTLLGEEIDNLFLPKCVRPGDILEIGDTIAFCGHVGPPLDSRVDVTITAPSGQTYSDSWYANKIGWLYDPDFDIPVEETGRWTVNVFVEYDSDYLSYGLPINGHNTGTVLGTQGQYEFYVVEPDSPRLYISNPQPGFITWPNYEIEPISIQGIVPMGTTAIYYTIHDKGVVMGQGSLEPQLDGSFTLVYDAEALHQDFPMLSLTSHEGRWEGLADEVTINLLAVGSDSPFAANITLIGEQVFVQSGTQPDRVNIIFLPMTVK